MTNYLFTSESVSEGHPDKISDLISDTIVDMMISKYPFSRVACETLVTSNKVVIAGEYRLNKEQIISLLPHRDPMLLIDELYDIKALKSATAIVNVKKNSFFVQGHFPNNPVMPGVLIVESFGQAAAALTAHGLDRSTYENKLVFLMGVEKARFRNPVIPDCKLILKIDAIRSHGRVWKYKGEAFVNDIKMADAIWSATIVDKK